MTNLHSRPLTTLARTTDDAVASATINVDFGAVATYYIGVVALIAHNISTDGKVRVRGSSVSSFATAEYDSGWVNVWPSGVIPEALLEWEDDNFWLGTVSAQTRAGYAAPYICLTTRVVVRYWRIEIDNTTNSDTYLQIGRLFMGDVWTPAHNYSYNAEIGWNEGNVIDTALDGTEYADLRYRYRTFRFNFDWLSESEAYSNALELQRLVGSSGESVVVPDSADATYGFQRNIYGRLLSMSPIAITPANRFKVELHVKELL